MQPIISGRIALKVMDYNKMFSDAPVGSLIFDIKDYTGKPPKLFWKNIYGSHPSDDNRHSN